MQYKSVMYALVIAFYGFLHAEHELAPGVLSGAPSAQPQVENKVNELHMQEKDPVDEILAILDQKVIQAPAMTPPPSPFKRWCHSVLISLAYKYYAFKEWLLNEEQPENHEAL